MEGKRAQFALPGNGSGTNSLGGWLKVLAVAATGIDLMGNAEGSKCQYLFISAASQSRQRRGESTCADGDLCLLKNRPLRKHRGRNEV